MVLCFSITLFLSAALLFLLQPMFAKLVLPLLGGVPTVWNTAMFFYQGMLLLGYGYAHLASRWLSLRAQAVAQVLLLLLTALFLPLTVAAGWTPPASGSPIPWLLGLFVLSIGLPFFTVATTSPLLQRWFSLTNHAAAGNPYFLYASSNLGSMVALLAYPSLIEPFLRTSTQAQLWSGGFFLLCLALGGCVWVLYRNLSPAVTLRTSSAEESSVSWRMRLHWVLLALVPSSLLLGVTTFITTELASVPLLWVVPLILYLLTFVIVFSQRPILKHQWMVRLQPMVILPLVITYKMSLAKLSIFIPLHLLAFSLFAMVCHGELSKRRPDPRHLTEFYFWVSFGGVVGGAFNAIIAPTLFSAILEYPLAMVLACLLRPMSGASGRRDHLLDLLLPMLVLALLLMPRLGIFSFGARAEAMVVASVMVVGLIVYTFSQRPVRFGLGIAAILVGFNLSPDAELLTRERSFFGVHRVTLDRSGDFHVLYHGTTIHGAEHRDPNLYREPLTYYHRGSPLGDLMATLGQDGRFRRAAVIGVGTGAATCYRQPGQEWDLYEIDPTVIKLARDTRYFHYLDLCAKDSRIILGDARLKLQQAPDGYYDLMILDAYSSDSIPVHLVTREAIALYASKLTDRGMMVINISNRYLDLGRLFAVQMDDAGLAASISVSPDQSAEIYEQLLLRFRFDSQWILATRTATDLDRFNGSGRWRPLVPTGGQKAWSDDYSNLVSIIRRG